MTSGCSWISFAMKWRWLPLSTSSELATDLIGGRSTRGRVRSKISTPDAVQDGPVAFVEIGDGVGERRERDGVEPRYISPLPWPMASGEPWRAAIIRSSWPAKMMPSAKAPCSLARAASHGVDRVRDPGRSSSVTRWTTASVSVSVSNMWPLRSSSALQLAEILDDAVVDDRDLGAHVRMGVALGRPAVRRPARVADAGAPCERLVQQAAFEIAQLALGAAALEVAVLDRGDAGRVIAAILEPAQRIDEIGRDRLLGREFRRCRT